jgi:hypothetical protein
MIRIIWFRKPHATTTRRPAAHNRLGLHPLDDRLVPSAVAVAPVTVSPTTPVAATLVRAVSPATPVQPVIPGAVSVESGFRLTGVRAAADGRLTFTGTAPPGSPVSLLPTDWREAEAREAELNANLSPGQSPIDLPSMVLGHAVADAAGQWTITVARASVQRVGTSLASLTFAWGDGPRMRLHDVTVALPPATLPPPGGRVVGVTVTPVVVPTVTLTPVVAPAVTAGGPAVAP